MKRALKCFLLLFLYNFKPFVYELSSFFLADPNIPSGPRGDNKVGDFFFSSKFELKILLS